MSRLLPRAPRALCAQLSNGWRGVTADGAAAAAIMRRSAGPAAGRMCVAFVCTLVARSLASTEDVAGRDTGDWLGHEAAKPWAQPVAVSEYSETQLHAWVNASAADGAGGDASEGGESAQSPLDTRMQTRPRTAEAGCSHTLCSPHLSHPGASPGAIDNVLPASCWRGGTGRPATFLLDQACCRQLMRRRYPRVCFLGHHLPM